MIKMTKPITLQQNIYLQKLFTDNPKRDFSLDSFLDAGLGEMYVDNLDNPRVARLDNVHGFVYFAGKATTASRVSAKRFNPALGCRQ